MGSSFSVSTIFTGKDRMSPIFNKMGKKAAGFGDIIKGILGAQIIQRGVSALKTGLTSFITEASKIEDATAAFTPLMGNVEKATSLVDALNITAATTPFQFEDISAAAKQLLPVMNGNIKNIIDTFRMIGDTAGGNAQKLDSITRGFMKSMLKGKVDMESLNMISEAGVPIYSELASSMGVSVAEMMKMSSAGKISSNDLQKAFQVMTSEGGIFFNGMQIASETLTGRISTLKDNISLTAAAIGQTILPKAKQVVTLFTGVAGKVREWAVANREIISGKIDLFISKVKNVLSIVIPQIVKIGKSAFELGKAFMSVVKVLFSGLIPSANQTGGIFIFLTNTLNVVIKIITVVVNAIRPLVAILKPLAMIIFGLIAAYKAWIIVQTVINVVMSANPISLIIIGIAALIVGIIALVQNLDKVKAALISAWQWTVNLWDKMKGLAAFIGGPFVAGFVFLIEIIRSVVSNWNDIKSAFTDGGFLAGIKAIGMAILSGILAPVESLLELISKIPGVGKLTAGLTQKVTDLRNSLNNIGEKNNEAPNRSEVEARQRAEWTGQLNIAGAPAGSTLEQKSKGAPPLRYQMLGAN